MLTYNDRYKYELEKLLNKQIERISEILVHGNAGDYAKYQYLVGCIAGLRTAIDQISEAETVCKGN
mgnify:CR=1 FL=1